MNKEDKLILNGHEFTSRFILGSGKYSLELIKAAVENSRAENKKNSQIPSPSGLVSKKH